MTGDQSIEFSPPSIIKETLLNDRVLLNDAFASSPLAPSPVPLKKRRILVPHGRRKVLIKAC